MEYGITVWRPLYLKEVAGIKAMQHWATKIIDIPRFAVISYEERLHILQSSAYSSLPKFVGAMVYVYKYKTGAMSVTTHTLFTTAKDTSKRGCSYCINY